MTIPVIEERVPAVSPAGPGTGPRAWWLLLRLRLQGNRAARGVPGTDTGAVALDPVDLGVPRLDDLYHRRRLELVRLALLLVDDVPTAEDVVQDTFTAVFKRYGEWLTDLDDPDAYLRTSVVNRARSVLRRRRTVRAHVPRHEGHAAPAEEHVLLREEHREVLAALGKLTRRQREVLVLRYWSHLTEAQIADSLGLSRGAVKSTASRALQALGRRLRTDGTDAGAPEGGGR